MCALGPSFIYPLICLISPQLGLTLCSFVLAAALRKVEEAEFRQLSARKLLH